MYSLCIKHRDNMEASRKANTNTNKKYRTSGTDKGVKSGKCECVSVCRSMGRSMANLLQW